MTAVSPDDVELTHEMLDRMALYNIVDKYRVPRKSFYTQKSPTQTSLPQLIRVK